MAQTHHAFVLEPTYEQDEEEGTAKVHLWCRLKDGRTALVRKPFKPYFFIRSEDEAQARNNTGAINTEFEPTKLKSMTGEPVTKVTTGLPKDVSRLRESFERVNIQCYEADIRFAYRAMMDWGVHATFALEGDEQEPDEGFHVDTVFDDPVIKPAEESYTPSLTILSFDIESDKESEQLFALSTYGKDHEGKDFQEKFIISKEPVEDARHFKTEKQLLEAFVKHLQYTDPDVITGWNVIDFDLDYLRRRAQKARVNLRLGRDGSNLQLRVQSSFFRDSSASAKGRLVLDGIHLLRNNFVKLPDYKLDTAAQAYADDDKLIKTTGHQKYLEIKHLYEHDKKALLEYNLLDAKLAYDVIMNSGAFPLTIKRSLLVGMPLDRVNASIASLDSLYLRELRQRGFVAPVVGGHERDRGVGGFVMQSKPGVYDYVIVCDFKSLYPSVMRTFNIDPLMYVPPEQAKKAKGKELIGAPNGAHFRRDLGIVPGLIQRFWKERDQARKDGDELARYAIKIHMNSIYGVLASPNCRFFNRQVGNAITSFAQHFIKLTAQHVEEQGYDVIYGDSVTGDRCVTIQDERGLVEVVPFEELFKRYEDHVMTRNGKEVVRLDGRIRTLSVTKKDKKPVFSPVKALIRHETRKKTYTVWQKHGSTTCTADHSLITDKDGELTPTKPQQVAKDNRPFATVPAVPGLTRIRRIDLYDYLKDYEVTRTYKGRPKTATIKVVGRDWLSWGWTDRKEPVLLKRFIDVHSEDMEALCRLLGLYIAEGSASTPETTPSRMGVSIACSDRPLLEGLKKDYERLFRNVTPNIIESYRKRKRTIKQDDKTYEYEDRTLKLQLMNSLTAVFFKALAGQRSKAKKLPRFIHHLSRDYQLLLLKYMVLGDGSLFDKRYKSEYVKRHFRYATSSLRLASGLSLLLRQLGISYNVQYWPSKQAYRISTAGKSNARLHTRILANPPTNGYVYDMSVEDGLFADACGQVLLHNTDSVFVNLACDSYDEAQKLGKKIERSMNRFLEGHVKEAYGLDSFLELEFEKTFIRFVLPYTRGSDKGAKKRYAGLIKKEDGSEDISFTGLEMVRRDWTDLAKEFQYELYRRVFRKEEVAGYVKKFIEDLKAGRLDGKLVYRKALRKDVDEYTKTTPPHVKAARKLDELDSDIIEYVITVDGPEPLQKLESDIDYEHYIDKQLRPIADSILGFYDTSFDDQLSGSSQRSLGDF